MIPACKQWKQWKQYFRLYALWQMLQRALMVVSCLGGNIIALQSALQIVSLQQNLQAQSVSSGTLRRVEHFPSRWIHPRTVDVWLPEGYDSTKRYAVLYMHDGQMLFDSTTTWNHQEWRVEETLTELFRDTALQQCIVVGVWNNGLLRRAEYFPERVLSTLPRTIRDSLVRHDLHGTPLANAYLRFLVRELKPYIDRTFSTHTKPESTWIAGSSMGGLISLYALCEYPQVFGRAACLSTHWVGSVHQPPNIIPKALALYVAQRLPAPRAHRIYFDYGTATLDSLYKPHQVRIDAHMRRKGYTASNWITREFVGAEHSERAWSARLAIPLRFLLEP